MSLTPVAEPSHQPHSADSATTPFGQVATKQPPSRGLPLATPGGALWRQLRQRLAVIEPDDGDVRLIKLNSRKARANSATSQEVEGATAGSAEHTGSATMKIIISLVSL